MYRVSHKFRFHEEPVLEIIPDISVVGEVPVSYPDMNTGSDHTNGKKCQQPGDPDFAISEETKFFDGKAQEDKVYNEQDGMHGNGKF